MFSLIYSSRKPDYLALGEAGAVPEVFYFKSGAAAKEALLLRIGCYLSTAVEGDKRPLR
jgi:hypothetical protein